MQRNYLPVSENELQRLMSLYDLDLDYSALNENFKDLTRLAAKIAGTDISLVNLIDTYTQWTVSNYGLDLEQMPREDSACQYTIMGDDYFEVSDLSADVRFKDKFYVHSPLDLRYYFGLPLQTDKGVNIGALCVMDKYPHHLDEDKRALLKIIGDEIVNRLKSYKAIDALQYQLKLCAQAKKKAAHDIRSPLSGIIGLSKLICPEDGEVSSQEEIRIYMEMILSSSEALMHMADQMLSEQEEQVTEEKERYNLTMFKEELLNLYLPQAVHKKIGLRMVVVQQTRQEITSRNKLLQIAGNLMSNAIKFTPGNGTIEVVLDFQNILGNTFLKITVSDTGIGLSEEHKKNILNGKLESTSGTQNEKGYGYGLSLIKQLVSELAGHMYIHSQLGEGTTFEVLIPQNS